MGRDMLTEDRLGRVRALNDVAARRGQTLAQLALVWALRDPRMTSLVIGASSVAQLEANVGALDQLDLTDDELAEIDRVATDADVNLWARSSTCLTRRQLLRCGHVRQLAQCRAGGESTTSPS